MATINAVKTGNWSDTTVWDLGRLPTSDDDVNLATYTVTLNVNNAVARDITKTGISSTLKLSDGSAITARYITQTTLSTSVLTTVNASVNATVTCVKLTTSVNFSAFNCNVISGYTITFNGNLESGSAGTSAYAISFGNTGTLIINGNLTPNTAAVINSISSGTIIVNGIVYGSSGVSASLYTINLAANNICIIHGGIHMATYSTKTNYLPISLPFFMDFGDNSKAEFGAYGVSGKKILRPDVQSFKFFWGSCVNFLE